MNRRVAAGPGTLFGPGPTSNSLGVERLRPKGATEPPTEESERVGHDPDAPNVVIMSLVVDPLHQGQGLARALMEEFERRVSALDKSAIHLICKKDNIEVYEKLGYRYVRRSTFAHGSRTWHEMLRARPRIT